MSECTFCLIRNGELPASTVYEDELVSAFMDIQPVNAGHVLVVPNHHYSNLAALPPAVGERIFRVGQRVAAALYGSGLECEGVNFFLADGEAAGQEVFHVHLHVFPRFDGDGFGLNFHPDYFELPEREELDAAAERIRAALSGG